MMNFYQKKEDQIAWGQAINLAVEMAAVKNYATAEEATEKIRALRLWFYEEISKPSPKADQYPPEPQNSYAS